MSKLFLLFSHNLTEAQESDAKDSLGVTSFVTLPAELQNLWSNVPSSLESLEAYFEDLKHYLEKELKQGDVVLVQGDFGATCSMVRFVKGLGAKAVYATTTRDVVEKVVDDKIVKTSVFKHVRFRVYA